MTMQKTSKDLRVLSIQSHVVSGYVGNRSACFPLQLLGFEVDLINSVHISNHTGYGGNIAGQLLNADELTDIYNGLKRNNLLNYTHILTGYVGTVTFLSKLIEIIKEIKIINPKLCYICDPVMGDNGKMYVPEEVIPLYRDHLLPMADIITPNQYETELLTGISIKSESDVKNAINIFHKQGLKTIIVSSTEFASTECLSLFGSSLKDDCQSLIRMDIPKIPVIFTGTGDLLAALLLAWMSITKGDLKTSCEKAINTLQCVLCRTLHYAQEFTKEGEKMSMHSLELKLIQSKKDIEDPPSILKAVSL